jgi:hypothetical protein
MNDKWTDEPTRIHQYTPPAAGAPRAASGAHESSTVVVDRESLMARVSASMAVPENDGRTVARTRGVPLTFPFGHEPEDASADLTPPPVQTRRQTHPPASSRALRKVRARGAGIRAGTHLAITVGIAGSFMLGLSLRNDPRPSNVPGPALVRTSAAAPVTSPSRAAPAVPAAKAAPAETVATRVVPARARLKITSSPGGAYVALDGEVGPGPTPREVEVALGRWVTINAQLPGFQPVSRSVFVQQATTEIDIPFDADE